MTFNKQSTYNNDGLGMLTKMTYHERNVMRKSIFLMNAICLSLFGLISYDSYLNAISRF